MYLCRLLKPFHNATNIIPSLPYTLSYLLLKLKIYFLFKITTTRPLLLFETYKIEKGIFLISAD